jgi:mRNA-degrading endonuclease HigB of HigAB toxin-antitoxin module
MTLWKRWCREQPFALEQDRNKYRLVVWINYDFYTIYIRFLERTRNMMKSMPKQSEGGAKS